VTSPLQPDEPGSAPDAVEAARDLTGALNGLSQRLDDAKTASEERDQQLSEYGRRNRQLIRRSRRLIAVDIVLTIALALVGLNSARSNDRADTAVATAAVAKARAAAANTAAVAEHQSLIAGCEAGNVNRKNELGVWDYLLDNTTPTSKAQAKALAKFGQKIDQAYAPRNCVKVYPLPAPKG
jgi:hypothetical protein